MTHLSSHLAKLENLADGHPRYLPTIGGQLPSWHLWQPCEVDAVTLALASQRPLLVRGEPGTGKSQLARATAVALGWVLHSNTLHARTEAHDLLYHFDAVRRLADAQAQKLTENERAYWQPQALWQALDWDSACGYGDHAKDKPAPPGHVVLIDEIDKAPSDVPNGLLEVLGTRCFNIPGLNLAVQATKGAQWPLVIITTNEERELPAAFLRRCMVLTHSVPQDGYHDFLLQHGQAHFGPGRSHPVVEGDADAETYQPAIIARDLLALAATQLVEDRQNAQTAQVTPPGLAEYLDLLYALHQIAPGDNAKQTALLTRMKDFAYLKNRIEEGGNPALMQQHSRTAPPTQPASPQPTYDAASPDDSAASAASAAKVGAKPSASAKHKGGAA